MRARFLVALFSLFPLAAFAQEALPAPSLWSQLLSPGNVALALGGALTLLGLLLGPSEVRRRRVAKAVYRAFQIVNDVDEERGDAALDKPVAGLKAANEWMKANGWRELTLEEQALARLEFSAMHGEEKQAVKLGPVASPS